MIPYFAWTSIVIGPLTLQVWGIFVGLGFFLAAVMAGKLAKRRGLDASIIYDLTVWMVLAGLIGGRLGHVLFYAFPEYLANPLEIFAIWHGGLSMFGGLIACVIVGLWFLRKKKVDVWQYVDVAVYGLPFGIMIGRLGCFLIHDHPGTATHFFLGVQYPGNVVRHDYGLYEMLNGAGMAVAFLWLAHKKAKTGTFVGVFSLWYGLFRLLTDGGRLVDARYLGLTPGQYLGAILAIIGLWLLWITKMRKQEKVLT
ncbi:TPA: prolipoprotein diacylglyceryl transferase [Candidatus Uhrbacteria bacterium]|nr:prolipoprotein diacylglyceryl transferase [Candidatus Uhrbacteria bacterium]